MTESNPLDPAAAPDAHEVSSPSGSSSDPASSLRAAALLTLKSKRRRPAGGTSVGASLPARPAPHTDGGAQLDYGQDDVASSPPAQVSQPAQLSQATDIQDGQTREEGEISDSEEQLALSAKALPSKAPPAKHQPRKPSPPPSAPEPPLEPPVDVPPPRPSPKTVIPKQESPPHPLERLTDNTLPGPPSSSGMTGIEESQSRNTFYVDDNHVRPGLALTQTQYDTCKDVILDLLGWGVPTDYLMSCGLSREVIYFVFTELNLRLPPNFDPTGLVPYIPGVDSAFTMPPPPIPLDVTTSPHHGLPPRPPIPGQSYPLTPTTPSTAQSLDGNSLHDMERLRREELRARKMAVQATRKPKQAAPSPGTSSVMSSSHPASTELGQDVEMTPAQHDSVDDFLKTIEPTPEHPEDAMDLDEIPGLGGSQSASHSPTPTSQPVVVGQVLLSPTFASNNGSTGSLSASSLDGQGSRRRPVAADFVDMEGHAKNGNGVHSDTHVRHLRRAKNSSSFANVGKTRRLVINVSDSEEDADGDYQMDDSGEPEPSSTPNTVIRTQSPAILAETEKEIARMKRLIAEREKQKLHRTNTLDSASLAVKQDDDMFSSSSTPANGSSSSDQTILQSVVESPATSVPATPPIAHGNGPDSQSTTDTSSSIPVSGVQDDQTISSTAHDVERTSETVDVDSRTSSSTQPLSTPRHEEKPSGTERFSKYESPFSSYPLLRSRPNALNFPEHTQDISTLTRPATNTLGSSISSSSSLSITPSSSSITSTAHSSSYIHTDAQKTFTPNLRELNYIATAHALNPKKFICQYEIPGGGVCRDAKCKDIHLSRIQGTDGRVEPTDADTALFLSRSLEIKLNTITSALKQVRAEHPTITLEERVARALQLLIHPT